MTISFPFSLSDMPIEEANAARVEQGLPTLDDPEELAALNEAREEARRCVLTDEDRAEIEAAVATTMPDAMLKVAFVLPEDDPTGHNGPWAGCACILPPFGSQDDEVEPVFSVFRRGPQARFIIPGFPNGAGTEPVEFDSASEAISAWAMKRELELKDRGRLLAKLRKRFAQH